ncbi:alpha/beta hydrolase family protein [Geothrix fuzhouensis]|uniref:alpha/beta hydrolase family protein n=1 Tax=Geothrix fuzhouensis TaxID=2966451 RepID=UPI00214874DA|nr:alpha/beta hydrolase [Geothrix fuzhouensis]
MRPRSNRRRRWFWILTLILGALGLLAGTFGCLAGPGLRWVASLSRAADGQNPGSCVVEERSIPAGGRLLALRLYRPMGAVERVLVLVHGIHGTGYDETRLVRSARFMAGQGILVATPEIPDLKAYDLTARTLDDIEATTRSVLEDPLLRAEVPRHRPILCGISFAGGLCLSVATRPSLRARLACVFSIGGHGDLDRVMGYLSTGELPEGGGHLLPHPYGQAVLLRLYAGQLVPPEQREALRASLLIFLQEPHGAFADSVASLPRESRRIAELCLKWDAKGVCDLLRPLVGRIHADPLLSPLRGPVPECPVFLLHGSADDLIPPSETRALARWAGASTETHVLVSDLVRHVEFTERESGRFQPLEVYRLGRFLTRLLRC